jgi:hypothetical protein
MNILGLASIAFGTGVASRSKMTDQPSSLSDDTALDLENMAVMSAERAGGVCCRLLSSPLLSFRPSSFRPSFLRFFFFIMVIIVIFIIFII